MVIWGASATAYMPRYYWKVVQVYKGFPAAGTIPTDKRPPNPPAKTAGEPTPFLPPAPARGRNEDNKKNRKV